MRLAFASIFFVSTTAALNLTLDAQQATREVRNAEVSSKSSERPSSANPLSTVDDLKVRSGVSPELSGYSSSFQVVYQASIPYDHVTGGPSVKCFSEGKLFAIYLGDIPYGSPQQFHTNRTALSAILYPGGSTADQQSGQTSSVGLTSQFYRPTPVNGEFISLEDYDSPGGTCHKFNASGQAVYGQGSNTYSTSSLATGPASSFVQFSGQIANPLQFELVLIKWAAVRVDIQAVSDSVNGIAKVSGKVTCFPYHSVVVDGVQVAFYEPKEHGPFYIGRCLIGPADQPLIGPGTTSDGVQVPPFETVVF